jgi:hypothetical protein
VKSHDAIVLCQRALDAGHVLHARDLDGVAITAGRVGGELGADDTWEVLRWAPRGQGIERSDCGSMAAVARALVRHVLGPTVASEAAARALGEEM